MDLGRDAVLFSASLVAGAVNSIAGGGTLLSFPAAIAWGLPSTVANATNAVALMPGSLASAWAYRRELKANARLVRLLVPPAVLGGLAGAVLLHATPVRVFDAVVPWLVLMATLVILLERPRQSDTASSLPTPSGIRRREIAAVGCQLAVGVYGGFFGAAMGIVMLAFLSLTMATDMHHRNALKNLLAVVINGAASIYFVASSLISPRAAAIMMGGAVLGGYLGGRFGRRVPVAAVRSLVVAIGVGLSAMLAYRSLASD